MINYEKLRYADYKLFRNALNDFDQSSLDMQTKITESKKLLEDIIDEINDYGKPDIKDSYFNNLGLKAVYSITLLKELYIRNGQMEESKKLDFYLNNLQKKLYNELMPQLTLKKDLNQLKTDFEKIGDMKEVNENIKN